MATLNQSQRSQKFGSYCKPTWCGFCNVGGPGGLTQWANTATISISGATGDFAFLNGNTVMTRDLTESAYASTCVYRYNFSSPVFPSSDAYPPCHDHQQYYALTLTLGDVDSKWWLSLRNQFGGPSPGGGDISAWFWTPTYSWPDLRCCVDPSPGPLVWRCLPFSYNDNRDTSGGVTTIPTYITRKFLPECPSDPVVLATLPASIGVSLSYP